MWGWIMCVPRARMTLTHAIKQLAVLLRNPISIPTPPPIFDTVKVGDQKFHGPQTRL
jgi:hypothetical protein